MKNKFKKIAKSLGVDISVYHTYRSDMCVQVYNIHVKKRLRSKVLHFHDGYFIGSGEEEKNKVLKQFESEIKSEFNV